MTIFENTHCYIIDTGYNFKLVSKSNKYPDKVFPTLKDALHCIGLVVPNQAYSFQNNVANLLQTQD